MATVSHPRPGVLRELALRKPQGPFGVPTDLAVRGAASLADALHQVVATSFTQHRQLNLAKTESAANWRKKGHDAKLLLDKVRPRVRYSLPGADLGLRDLARLPDLDRPSRWTPRGTSTT